jgi:hypothetical protein
MKSATRLIILLASLLTAYTANAVEDPAHQELRILRTQMIDAVTKGDIDTVIKNTHPNAVITWQNATVCRGHQGLKDFFEKVGKNSFKGYKLPPTPDDLTIFYGDDTGVSYGETIGQFNLLGKSYEFKSRWTATVVKENGKWQLAAYHVSMDALDNPILSAAKRAFYVAAISALIVGLFLGKLLFRKKLQAS